MEITTDKLVKEVSARISKDLAGVDVRGTVLGDPVATLARLYGSRYVLRGPSRDDIGILLGAGAALGWLGAWISAARHLRSIEPRA